jgi:twitching motility protein PilT
MAQFDRFIDIIFKYRAEGLVLASDERVMLVVGGEMRPMTAQPVTLAQVQDLVQEVVPGEQAAALQQDGVVEFPYTAPGGAVRIGIRRAGGALRVRVEPQAEAPMAGAGAGSRRGAARPLAAAGAGSDAGPQAGGGVAVATAARPAAAGTRADAVSGGGARRKPRLEALFELMVQQRCSDLHLTVGSPPLFRKHGEMVTLGNAEALDAATLRDMLLEVAPAASIAEFEARHDTDFSYEMSEQARFRCNLFLDRRGMGGVFRFIPGKIPTAKELGLSRAILELCELTKGLVLVTGPTGSGKSTTLAAMIDHINNTRTSHIITIEDPIEFVHANKRCLVNQREIGAHTEGFKTALRAALREDPDIVLVGEMRDLETVAIAIETAETGHLVFGTLHTNTAPSAIDRIIDQFPADRQEQVRTMLSESLRGVVAQTLVKKKNGGMVAAQEILLVNSAVSNLIREGKTFQIQSIIQTGRAAGMLTMNDALLDLVKSAQVDPRDAYAKAVARSEFKAVLERSGYKLD